MKTSEEQRTFFDQHAPAIQKAAKAGGARQVIDFIDAFDDPLERRVLYLFARHALFLDASYARDLDVYIQVANSGIDACLAQARAETDPEDAKKRTDLANVISYNLAADLADSWGDDGLVREERHFEVGHAAAERCVAWREELGKPPLPHSMAWWAKGMHELSLGRADAALESFEKSADFGREASRKDGRAEDAVEASFAVLLARGYSAIALASLGDADAEAVWTEVIDKFTQQLGDEATKKEAEFGMQQLRTVRERYWPDAS